MITPRIAGMMVVWIICWTITTEVFLYARKKYQQGNRRHRSEEISYALDLLGLDPARSLVLFLLFWPLLLLSFLGMIICAWAEKWLEESENRKAADE